MFIIKDKLPSKWPKFPKFWSPKSKPSVTEGPKIDIGTAVDLGQKIYEEYASKQEGSSKKPSFFRRLGSSIYLVWRR